MPKKLLTASILLTLGLVISGCKAVGSSKPAALQVTSVPEASVFLDGKHLGKTPFFSDQLKDKQYLVKLTAGEAVYTEKVDLISGTLTVVNRELNNNFLAQSGEVLWLEPNKKGLFITSIPPEAKITVDGKSYEQTPTQVNDLSEGEHKVTVAKPGYIEREFSVKTSNNYQLVADVTLASEIAKGFIDLSSPLPEPEMVEVLKTPQGFLRVRKEPSTTALEVGRVNTGDKLEIIQEDEEWIQVKFQGKQGWVSTQFVKKIS